MTSSMKDVDRRDANANAVRRSNAPRRGQAGGEGHLHQLQQTGVRRAGCMQVALLFALHYAAVRCVRARRGGAGRAPPGSGRGTEVVRAGPGAQMDGRKGVERLPLRGHGAAATGECR